MVKKEIKEIVNRYVDVLRVEGIEIEKVVLFGSYARGTAHEDSDIDVAIICKNFDFDPIEQNMKLWKLAVRVDTRLAPVFISPLEYEEEYIPIVPEIKKGVDLTPGA